MPSLTDQKPKAVANADLLPFPDNLEEWLEDHRKEQGLARLVYVAPGNIQVHLGNGSVTGDPAKAQWEGAKTLPLWAGDPFCGHRARQDNDPPGLYMLASPVQDSPGGVPCWRVAEDPACHCGVFLNAEAYSPYAEKKAKAEKVDTSDVDPDDPRLEGLKGFALVNMKKKIAKESEVTA